MPGYLTAVLVGWAVVFLGLSPARGQVDEGQFRKDLEALTAGENRIIGSPGYESAGRYIEQQIRALPNVELQVHEYHVMVPETASATLTIGGADERVYPFWPASVRVNATPKEGITGRAVYVGDASFQQLKPGQLTGQIAVVEAASGQFWSQAVYFGARAVIVVGTESITHHHLQPHELKIPINIPRFYVPAGALADRLRRGVEGEVTLKASVNWQRKVARNYYALVMPPAQIDGWYVPQPPAALMFSVQYDSSGLVPDLAKGAGQAVQAAAGLALLREMSAQPWKRPVVVYFGGADSIYHRATREMLMALSDPPSRWLQEMDELATERKLAERDLTRIQQLQTDIRTLDISKDRSVIDRVTKIIETDATMTQDVLFRLRTARTEDLPEELRNQKDELEARQLQLSGVRHAFQRKPATLAPGGEFEQSGREYLARTVDRIERLLQQNEERRTELQRRVDLYGWLADRVGRTKQPDERTNSNRLIELLVSLDFSDGGVRVGPMAYGTLTRASNINHVQDFRDWFSKRERELKEKKPEAAWYAEVANLVDLETLSGARSPTSWLLGMLPVGSELCQAWGISGMSMVTLDDLRLRRDTPNDTLENLKLEAILPQVQAVQTLFRRAWNDPEFRYKSEVKWMRNSIVGQVVSPAMGRPVPDLPREGFLVTHYLVTMQGSKAPRFRGMPWTVGVRRNEVRDCDAEGRYRIEGLPYMNVDVKTVGVQVYRVEKDTGAITASSDVGKTAADLRTNVNIDQTLTPLRSLVFECAEFALVGLYDPRFLQDLGEVVVLDARRNAEPQRYNLLLDRQMLAGFVERDVFHLLFRYGRVGNRLVLLNMPDVGSMEASRYLGKDAKDLARGFDIAQLNALGPLSMVTAKDFLRTDKVRLENYRKAGVSSALLDRLHAQAEQQIADAEAAKADDRGADMVKHANGAWANEARVYLAAQDMARDVIRAAIFLLLLCVPFSFCMERLLIGTPNIYKQIAWMFVIFAIMTAALWSFHPAFQISTSPLIIILAFAIILMSMVVIGVVYSKFDTELKRLRSGRGTAASASFARAGVLMSAVLLGIANMRKRKFRTALTSITVVLITFAVLCFTSASRFLETTTLPTGEATPYPGVMLRQRGFRQMPAVVVSNLQAVLGPEKQLVERWWNVSAWDPKDQLHLVRLPAPVGEPTADASGAAAIPLPGSARPIVYAVEAVLGLSPGESRLSQIAQVIGKEKYDRLERGETDIVYMSSSIAGELKVREGEIVKLGGIDLQVAGIFDANEFDQRVRMLSGEPLAPLKYSSGALDASGKKLTDVNAESLDLDSEDSASELAGAYEHLSATQFVIVPAQISKMLSNASLRSVEMRLADQKEVEETADELSRRFSVALFAGYEDGVKMVAASNLASVSGAGQVAIPLAIAGLIIFNTMMGSIAERRREIHVYTSLGLAPMHVGALFVAEAMTYGLIGAVFGYVIGQGAGTAMLHLGWLGNVTLNYSGTSAMLTLSLILLIVLLSALVPARIASKIAAPSIDRTWKVPLPKGDEIIAQLPFTINKTAADGALAYLAEYFEAHQEGSIGKFSAGKIEPFIFEDDKQNTSRGLKTVIWLTPFDLGVRQHLMLLIHPGQFEDIYEVQVVLQRLSGDDGSWYRMNRSFLTELRKQFLQWRSLSPQRMLDYVEESRRLFRKPEDPVAVVTTTSGEDLRLG